MSLHDWLLFLHVLAAFLLVAGVVAFGVIVLGSGGRAVRAALAGPALALWNAGGIGVLVLGVALAFDAYEIWDGWIVAALVLWVVASAAGGRLSRTVREGTGPAGALFAVMAAASAAILVDMLFKPGA